ncbi:deoxyribodipyrimidine photo-lyase-like isoform X2 [Xenia sp. Carnegie-2017]|uniref:deoxyribodipyrimidine photo-lyase-like isoform X2 n=1 Tax=Xenia sp. Carnegie-2017 TaxID=2897299 RepID=UPI001F04256A|nr:deoxyribodipyrimidine photo-lyase-like isoform X2 [Xenia sp. Carnegie-2017]
MPNKQKRKPQSDGEASSSNKKLKTEEFNNKRMRTLSKKTDVLPESQGIVYWMFRDQRVQDNWAMIYAQNLAVEHNIPLHVCFTLPEKFRAATIRQYGFIIKGLQEMEKDLKDLDISFHVLLGDPSKTLLEYVKSNEIGGVVTDFSPLREVLAWLDDIVSELPDVPVFQVDAHNIVPCWVASEKLEYAARTIRPKITKQLPEFLTEFPLCKKHPFAAKKIEDIQWDNVHSFIKVDDSVKEVTWAKPGSKAGLLKLEEFSEKHLESFSSDRNDPTKDALSNLSPWFHAGQVSVQRAILTVSKQKSKWKESTEAYIEEAVVRRELADNFCYYNKNYDSIEGASDWAKKTLNDHLDDKREYVYTLEEFETAKTHDKLWNAAQLQVIREGKMHGFLRMYWAKKILEWTQTPKEALDIAIYLNDKYQLDGNDPNGFVGCMWSVCGVHDQGWKEREIFGKIRYMNYEGCKRKFDVEAFEAKYK